jgi:hypothetical protein
MTPPVRDLRQLLAFKQAEWAGIEIWGKGALDGSDLKTQQKIKEISKIVKELIAQFGDRFTVMKVQNRPGNGYSAAHVLKPYWDPPTALAKEKFQRSTISFQELIQIQIEEWTREVSAIGGRGLDWESLLLQRGMVGVKGTVSLMGNDSLRKPHGACVLFWKTKIDSIKSPILVSTLRKLKRRFSKLKSVLSAG